MQALLSLIVICLLALATALLIDLYLIRRNTRRWLGLSFGSASVQDRLRHLLKGFYGLAQRDIEQVFIRAGIYNRTLPKIYTSMKLLLASTLALVVMIFGEAMGFTLFSNKLLTAAALFSSVLVIPEILLRSLSRRRVDKISAQLPYILDLMSVCMQSGMTIEASTAYLGEELKTFDRDLAYIMSRLDSVARLYSMKQALQELAEDVPSQQMNGFVYTLTQSLRYGSSIADVLGTQAAHIRQISMLTMEEEIGKLSSKMSLPMIAFIMLPAVILMVAPGIMRLMSGS
ncbi:type II secretion system F family protein [Sansalvadorimonas verongulae]|uniref:type II secretion system F family protein n=1 Tax=Sansalvadorimonas verongulae TaxID=2172824 RepID=UPI0012BBB645|nr:type II secretion system F family protein [Sansalvadorimonas verongulae]MTI15562.1 type II secretion system F family protein [Sansalvadorimonas verongulae]